MEDFAFFSVGQIIEFLGILHRKIYDISKWLKIMQNG